MTVTVAHPSLAARAGHGHRHWIYADEDESEFRQVAHRIPATCARLLAPEDFAKRVAAARAGFVTWVDRCLQGAPAENWLTTPLYKNPHDNPLFLHFCWLAELDRRMADGTADILVVTKSSGLAATVAELCRGRGIRCNVSGRTRHQLVRVRQALRGFARLCAQILQMTWRMACARMILGAGYRSRLAGTEALIDLYVLEHDISDQGRYTNRYFPGLLEYYAERGIRIAVYPFLYAIPGMRVGTLFRRMKLSRFPFAPVELFVGISDLAWAIKTSLRAAWARPRIERADGLAVDLRPLAEWHQPVTAMRAFVALVRLRAPARLASAGIRPRWVIDWYENQPIDKANQIGFTRNGLESEVIAVRQYPPAPDYPSLYTTAGEVKAGVSPRINWVCGRAQLDQMAVYDGIGTYRLVPALRYSHLHRSTVASGPGTQLLILLPYLRSDAQLLLELVIPSLPEISHCFAGVAIKPHHTAGLGAVRDEVEKQWPATRKLAIEWSEAPVEALLAEARIVVTVHSSAALEAVCWGRPVIVIGHSAGLSISPLEGIDERLWRVAYDAPELTEIFKQWSPAHPVPFAERAALGRLIRDTYFEPITDAALARFIPDIGAADSISERLT